MKTMLQIIDETAGAYTSATRATIEGTSGCAYQNAKGHCCAVGRCMENPLSVENGFAEDADSSVTALDESSEDGLDSLLKPEHRGHPIGFWASLQGLHDVAGCWCAEGLSERGRSVVQNLKDKWGEQ